MAVLANALRTKKEPNEEKRLELTEHLGELRQRIMRSFLYIAVGAGICYYRFEQIYGFLFSPMKAAMKGHGEWRIVFHHFTDAFMVDLQVSVVAGIIATAPLLTLEAWGFLGPALTRDEKKPLKWIAPLSIILFVAGVALAFWVSRYAIGWFVSFVQLFPNGVLYQDPKAYVMFMLKMMGVFGAVFQLPVVLAFLAWIGVLKSANMKKTWRHAVLGISVVGLIITPSNDMFSMAVMIVPVIFLYLGSIWLVQLIEKKRARQQQ